MNIKQLSFIIACYNVEKYIERTIESIFKGGYLTSDFVEVICINDGSTDLTLQKLNQIATFYPITIIDQNNQGVGITKNIGLETAQGQYVMILDADDWIDANVIAEMLHFSITHHIDLMAFGMQFVNESLEFLHVKNIFPGPFETVLTGRQVLLNDYQPSSVCLFLMHNKFFKEYNMRFYNGTQLDVEISTRLLLKAERVCFSQAIGYFYFRNEGSITKAVNIEKLKSYLYDSVRIAVLGLENIENESDKAIRKILIHNNNSIVWNLIWRFVSKPKEVDFDFKMHCLRELQDKKLYPITGGLKTNFQKITTLFFNQEYLLKWIFKIK